MNMGRSVPVGTDQGGNKNTKIIIGILALLLLAALGFWWAKFTPGSSPVKIQTSAPEGETVAGFSRGFILTNDAEITRSHHAVAAHRNGQSTDLFVAVYKTRSPINDLFQAYLEHLRQNGYEVKTSTASTAGDQARIFAERHIGSSVESVVISVREDESLKREVIITINRNS